MSVDEKTVRHIAHLARLAVTDDEASALQGELNSILDWVKQLSEVDTDGVEPMTSVVATAMRQREDRVSDGNYPEIVVGNAPVSEDNYFVVPKVVE